MDTIEQLKNMRDQAKARIEALPDYKLMVKLTTLVDELEQIFSGAEEGTSEEGSGDEAEGDEDVHSSHEETMPDETETDSAHEAAVDAIAAEAVGDAIGGALDEEFEYDEPANDPAPASTSTSKPAGTRSYNPAAANVLAELEKLTGGVADGEAQHDVEQTPATSPLDEVSEEIALDQSGAEFSEADEDISEDADSAILQAMAELEADLGNAEIDLEQEIKERRKK